MADDKQIFYILEESDEAGAGLSKRQAGDALGSANEAPVLPAVDLAGNMQHIALRDEGAVAAGVDSVPGLVAKDDSGNLAYLNLDSNGKLVTSIADLGVFVDSAATVAGVKATAVNVVAQAMVVSSDYIATQAVASATSTVLWELYQRNDATDTTIVKWITGPGQFTFDFDLNAEITSGATGTQEIRLDGTIISGATTDLHGYVRALKKA